MPSSPFPKVIGSRGEHAGDSQGDHRGTQVLQPQPGVALNDQRSILDYISGDIDRLETGLGRQDRGKLTEYLEAIRDIERTGHQLATGVVAAVAVTGAVNGLIASRGLSARARLAIALLTGAAPISAYAAWTLVRSNSRIWN